LNERTEEISDNSQASRSQHVQEAQQMLR